MHWHSYQVTTLVQITWYRNLHADPLDDDSKTLLKYNFYVSNDKTHDNYFVLYCLDSHWKNLQGCAEVTRSTSYGQMGAQYSLRIRFLGVKAHYNPCTFGQLFVLNFVLFSMILALELLL
jgi:hypothetical protein